VKAGPWFLMLVAAHLWLASPCLQAFDDAGGIRLIANWSGPLVFGPEAGPWRYDLQGELRYSDRGDGIGQFAIKPRFSYRINSKFSIGAGYGYYHTDARNLGARGEHRALQRLDWNVGYWMRAVVRSRTQLEQRFVEGRSGTGWWLRQRLRLEWRMGEAWDVQGIIGGEVFLYLRDTDWTERGYARSRMFAGIGWDLGRLDVEAGYLYQHDRLEGRTDLATHFLVARFRL
jgi:hypothetical protein